MSKFEYDFFYGGYDIFAVSQQRFNKEQAIDLYLREVSEDAKMIAVTNAFVRHRAGVNEDEEPCVGWWLEKKEYKRSCPVWVFHVVKAKDQLFGDYEYIEVN